MTNIDEHLTALVRKYNIAMGELDEHQFVRVIREAIASGDIIKHVCLGHSMDGGTAHKQSITYVPFSGVERLRAENAELKRQLAEVRKAIGGVP